MKIIKRTFIGIGSVVLLGGAALGISAANYDSVYAKDTKIGPINIGGLKPDTAAQKIKEWFGARLMDDIKLSAAGIATPLQPTKADKLGLTVDPEASLAQIKPDSFVDSAARTIGVADKKGPELPLVWKFDETKAKWLADFVDKNQPPRRAAKVFYKDKKIVYQTEAQGMKLDSVKLKELAIAAVLADGEIKVPIQEAPKHVSDDKLKSIKEVMSTFTTHFNYVANRVNNIQVASSKLDGIVLLPGETFSYNGTVGKRTIAEGFKEAPVLVSGRHEKGIGGGICQTSTTLYNASLLCDLKIVERHNHSTPVAYVPAGRDATVDYGSKDLKIQNNFDFPIAIARTFTTGSITFTILGKKDPSLKVEIIRGRMSTWGNGDRTEHDSSLPAGTVQVKEKGSSGKKLNTWRYVYKNGKLVRKDALGESYYTGSPRITVIGTGGGRSPRGNKPEVSEKPSRKVSKPVEKPETSEPATLGGSGDDN